MSDERSAPSAAKNRKRRGRRLNGRVRRARLRLVTRLRNYLLAGVLITAPIGITVYLIWLFVTFIDGVVAGLLPARYLPQTYLPVDVPGFGLLIVVVGLTVIGALARGLIGGFFVRMGERVVDRLPVVRSVYGALKQIFETVFAHQSSAFREVVLIEYPRRGIWAIGFVTGVTEGEVQNLTEAEMANIFLPTTPNPTSGFLLFLPRSDLYRLDMTVEEGIKMVVSGGIVTPPDRRPIGIRQTPVIGVRPDAGAA
ncbi:MAG: DUF502 domain-containing protein, partial [Alphaproteobacteria bacterium]